MLGARGARGAGGRGISGASPRRVPLAPLFLCGLCFVCGGREGKRRAGAGPPRPPPRAPFKVSGGCRRASCRDAKLGRALRSPRGNRRPQPAALKAPGRPRRAPRAPLSRPHARTRTHPHILGPFSRFSRRSQKFGASAGGQSRRRRLGARSRPDPPTEPPGCPRRRGPPRRALGLRRTVLLAGFRSFFSKMKEGTVVFAASSGLLLPPPLLHCTFKWKIFRSQQKHCVQKRLSRSYHQTLEETLPGKLPFGRKYWGICLFIGREMIPRRGENQGALLVFVRRSNTCFQKSGGPL